MNLEAQLLDQVNALIGELTGGVSTHADPFEALVRYFNLCDRIPGVRRWQVSQSRFLKSQSLIKSIQQGLQKFIDAARDGEDIRPWLHDAIFDDKQDGLMNDWGIQHYHLGKAFESGRGGRKRIGRTGELLYAMHRESVGNLYLIGIFDHGSFSEKQLLEIVNADWPDLLGHAKIKNVIDISHSPSSPEIHQLRKNQINSTVEINGEYFMGPGGGYTMSGHSTKAVMKAQGVKRLMRSLQKEVDGMHLSIRFVVQNRSVVLVDETNNRHCQIL